MARRKRRRSAAGTTRRRRRRSSVRAASANPRRRRRRGVVKFTRAARRRVGLNPRRRRRSVRRNPSFGGSTLLRQVARGFGDGLAITAGGGLSKWAASKVPFGQNTVLGRSVTQIVFGTILGNVARKVTKSERIGAMVIAGAYADVIRQNAASIPGVGGLLAGFGVYPQFAPVRAVGVYPRAVNPGIGVYPQAAPQLNGWAPRGVPNGNGGADPRMISSHRQANSVLA